MKDETMTTPTTAPDPAAMLAFGRAVLAQQSFSTMLGAELTAFNGSTVELTVPIRADLLQQNGFAHGGVVSYMADNALTFAGGLALGSAVLTSEFKINYVRPARGAAIVARATLVYGGRRQAVCRADIFARDEAGAETLVAVAQGTIAAIVAST